MDIDPNGNGGHPDLSGESDFHPAAPVIVATPAVTHPGAGPSSAMVTRSRARGGRETNVEPEVEFRPETEFLPEGEIPAETDEGVSGATRHLTDIVSQYRPEVTTSTSTTTTTTRLPPPIITRNLSTPHISINTTTPYQLFCCTTQQSSSALNINISCALKGNGVMGLTTNLVTLPSRCNQEPLMVTEKDGRPQEDLLEVHCFCDV